MAGIFISYRREDTSGEANHLASDLAEELGRDRVFIDIAAISPGVDFEQRIESALGSCEVVLVLIGNGWLSADDADGNRRLDAEGDFVRTEVATALRRSDVKVVPVLVDNARMPSAAELPEDISPLAKINALDLTNHRWRYDVDQIVRFVRRGGIRGLWQRVPTWLRFAVPLAAVAAAVALVALPGGGESPDPSNQVALGPATVAPAVDLCSRQLDIGVDGTFGPLSCDGGKLNQTAWQFAVGHHDPFTFTLGPNATPDQVTRALCGDLEGTTLPIMGEIYELAKTYYGWGFGLDPTPGAVVSVDKSC
jgi:hypothetical protein